ncbi:MAG: hypothetical protein Fur007_05200 [Rhodoferax sp.]
MNTPVQRAYEAPCPGCGAPVAFASAQSTHAVCAYCQSTVVRRGEVLARIGKMAELFDDHSPLQRHAQGRWGGQGFVLVGRLQYRYAEGVWSEWHALRDDGSSLFLSEDNGAYVMAWALATPAQTPPPEALVPGSTQTLLGQRYSVASRQQVQLCAAEGELPRLPALGEAFWMVELRSQGDAAQPAGKAPTKLEAPTELRTVPPGPHVLSLDYASAPPLLSVGVPVVLADLALSGLRDAPKRQESARQFNCPHCASPVTVTLASSLSVSCPACHSLIDLSHGLGGELAHALQDEPVQPLIALGSMGRFQGADWQVVGFQHRLGTDPEDPDAHFGWEEYLLYNAERGFLFLVDSTEGWSLVKPLTGAPTLKANAQVARYRGRDYRLKEQYTARTSYTLGEFYWQVQRDQVTRNSDFAAGDDVLSREQSADEVVWSLGRTLEATTVAQAFGRGQDLAMFRRNEAGPVSVNAGAQLRSVLILIVVLMVLSAFMSRCSDCDPATQNCASSRSSGGSFGGFSTGGGHK